MRKYNEIEMEERECNERAFFAFMTEYNRIINPIDPQMAMQFDRTQQVIEQTEIGDCVQFIIANKSIDCQLAEHIINLYYEELHRPEWTAKMAAVRTLKTQKRYCEEAIQDLRTKMNQYETEIFKLL